MGTDIHAFIEYDYADVEIPFSNQDFIRPFNEGELFWWRCYELFDALGDGRNFHFDEAEIEKHCLIAPRGLPDNYGHGVLWRYFYIADDHGYRNELHPSLGTITNQKADELIDDHGALLGPPLEITRKRFGTQSLRRIANPNWHSTSWLLLDEVLRSFEHFGYSLDDASTEVQISLNVMQSLEAKFGTGRSRLVFWFDS